MKLELTLVNKFESDFKGRHYYVYQFVDPQTLTILNYSNEVSLPMEIGYAYHCLISIKKNGLYVSEVLAN